jgi:hypothetical protein
MTQRDRVLLELRNAGAEGVTVRDFIYRWGITRSAAIVHSLRHHDGLDIETIDEGVMTDGRHRLARYVLRGTQPTPIRKPIETAPEFRVPEPIFFQCGCVRNADGRSWGTRCARHGPALAESTEMIRCGLQGKDVRAEECAGTCGPIQLGVCRSTVPTFEL